MIELKQMGQSGASSAEAEREKDAVRRDVRSISIVIGVGLGFTLGDGVVSEVVSFAPNRCFRDVCCPGALGSGTAGKAEFEAVGDPLGVGFPVFG